MWAEAAASNNAEWCDLVCRLSGVPGRFAADAWTAPRRTPPCYPDAVTLDRSVPVEGLLARIDTASPGCSVKDSFADLDLAPYGFRVLFTATWLYRPTGPVVEPPWRPAGPVADPPWRPVGPVADPPWRVVGERAGLPPGLADDPAVRILAGPNGGAVANRSATVVGLSNVYTTDGDLDTAWRGCLGAVAREFPDLPAVGYEHGPALAAALRQGFRPVGGLRVWLAGG